MTDEWGFEEKSFSNGCAYADFDNDGDLDLVVSNIDSEISLYQNNLSNSSFLQLNLKGEGKNKFGLGSKVSIYGKDLKQYVELTQTRGFQSSVSPKVYFGLNKNVTQIDSLIVDWPNGKFQKLINVKINQILDVDISGAEVKSLSAKKKKNTFFSSYVDPLFVYKHKENVYDDFKNEVLLPHKTSNFGPGISVGDLNGDLLDDVFVGAAIGYPSGLFFQSSDGNFIQQKTRILIDDLKYEDMDSLIFDADNDGDNDIYIVSGGNEYNMNSPNLQDRLYINDGNGNFVKSQSALPKFFTSGGRVYSNDFDKDGDLDLFITGRLLPKSYPYPANSVILENISSKGNAKFKDITNKAAPFFNKLGLATSASFADINNDGWDDLIVVGEWMPIKVFINNKGENFIDKTKDFGLSDTNGWWFSIKSADFDADGDQDFIVGNLGLNYKYKATQNQTFDIYFNDFDGNKKNDIVLSYFNDGKKYPVRGRQCSSQQIPSLKKKFKDYDSFSKATLDDVYGSKLNKSLHYQVKSFSSIYLENKNGKFITHDLPIEAQTSPANQILVKDFNFDGHLDVLLAGNLYSSEVETPRADAGVGSLLCGNSKGAFTFVDYEESGLCIGGDVKDIEFLNSKKNKYVIVAKNNDFLQFVKLNNN